MSCTSFLGGRYVLVTCLLGWAGLANAAEWVFALTDAESSRIFVDSQSIVRGRDGIAKLWFKTELQSPQDLGTQGQYISSKSLAKFQCASRTIWIKATTWYDGSNGVLATSDGDEAAPKYSDVVPETVGEQLFELACGNVPANKVAVPVIEKDWKLIRTEGMPCGIRSSKADANEIVNLQLVCLEQPKGTLHVDGWRTEAYVGCSTRVVLILDWRGIRHEQDIGVVPFPYPDALPQIRAELSKEYCPAPADDAAEGEAPAT